MYTMLSLKRLHLAVHLGWGDAERAIKQIVTLDLSLRFHTPPTASESDDLSDTLCYDTLCQRLQAACDGRAFKLIEHLGYLMYQTVKASLGNNDAISVCVCKQPPMASLHEACFTLSDWEH